MFKIIETTTSKTLVTLDSMKAIRAWLRKHYVRFYCIVDCERGVNVDYFGKVKG